MQPSKRIAVNTFAQYVRTIINLILTLYSSRLVLSTLGVEDYGIYSLVAGVVSLLSFLTNSLVGSTQRFLSVSQGKGDMDNLKVVFGNSLLLHILLGAIITLVLEAITPFIFDGFLNIPDNRTKVATILYQQVIWMVYISFIASPYKALLVSRENIVYTSAVDVIDGILKVVLVLALPYIGADKLMTYGWILFAIQCFNLFAYMMYSHLKYEECIMPKMRNFNWRFIRQLSGYTGWVVYSSAVIAFRNQGLAIVLNRVMGAVINAAYGIGSQISGMLSFVSSSFNNAIAPQLMASEGKGDRGHMWTLATVNSKVSFLLLSMLGIPAMFEMQELLELWLVDVPQNTIYFGCTFLLMQIVDQLSGGLGLANRAMGDIGKYTLVTYTPKLLVVPMGWLALKYGMPLLAVCGVMLFFETLCMYLRIYLLRNVDGFSLKEYCRNVILRPMVPCITSTAVCYILVNVLSFRFRFVVTFLLSVIVFCIFSYFFALTRDERQSVQRIISQFRNKR